MKKININLELGKLEFPKGDLLEGKSNKEIVKFHIENACGLYQMQEKGLILSDQRKIMKIFDALEEEKDGYIELEDDWFDYLYKIFTSIKFQGGTKIVVKIGDELERVKTLESKKKEKRGE